MHGIRKLSFKRKFYITFVPLEFEKFNMFGAEADPRCPLWGHVTPLNCNICTFA